MKVKHKSSMPLYCFRLKREVNAMRNELEEYRYYLEKNVARRTEYLSRRIELLEACNATLCRKLALSKPASGTASLQAEEGSARKLHLLKVISG